MQVLPLLFIENLRDADVGCTSETSAIPHLSAAPAPAALHLGLHTARPLRAARTAVGNSELLLTVKSLRAARNVDCSFSN